MPVNNESGTSFRPKYLMSFHHFHVFFCFVNFYQKQRLEQVFGQNTCNFTKSDASAETLNQKLRKVKSVPYRFEGFLASQRFVKKPLNLFFFSSKCKIVNHHLMLVVRRFFNISISLTGKTFRLRSVTQYMIISTQFISKNNISVLVKFLFYFTVVSWSLMFLKTNQHADININTGTTRQN